MLEEIVPHDSDSLFRQIIDEAWGEFNKKQKDEAEEFQKYY